MCRVFNFPVTGCPKRTQQPEPQSEQPMQKEIYAKMMYEFLGEIGYLLEFEKWLREKHYYDEYYLGYWEEYQQHKVYGDSQEDYEKWLREELWKDEYEDAHSNYFNE